MPVIFDQPFQILLDLARDDKIDPWDVDINKMADLYVDRVRRREKLDLRLSGRALCSASVLLRMKAENSPHNGNGKEEDELLKNLDFDMPDIGPVTLIRQNNQQITLSDLASSLEEVLEEKETPEKKKKEVEDVKDIMWEVDDYHVNIEEHIDEFHEKIALLAGERGRINFTQLLPEKDEEEICKNLLLALFLWSRQKIKIEQEDHFDDIYIELLEPPEGQNGS